MQPNEMYNQMRARAEKRAEKTKTRDRICSLILSVLPAFLVIYLLSSITQDLFGYGMGFSWAEESFRGHRGMTGFNFSDTIPPLLFLTFIIHFVIYKNMRTITTKDLWHG